MDDNIIFSFFSLRIYHTDCFVGVLVGVNALATVFALDFLVRETWCMTVFTINQMWQQFLWLHNRVILWVFRRSEGVCGEDQFVHVGSWIAMRTTLCSTCQISQQFNPGSSIDQIIWNLTDGSQHEKVEGTLRPQTSIEKKIHHFRLGESSWRTEGSGVIANKCLIWRVHK